MSTLKGSANVAAQIANDLAGQTCDITDDTILIVNADAATQTEGIFLTSNDGSRFKLSASDAGALTAEAV